MSAENTWEPNIVESIGEDACEAISAMCDIRDLAYMSGATWKDACECTRGIPEEISIAIAAHGAKKRALSGRATRAHSSRRAPSGISYRVYGLLPTQWYSLRALVFKRDGYRCVYCGSDGGGVSLHCDHVIPWSRGGETTKQNLATACRPCNSSKRDLTI